MAYRQAAAAAVSSSSLPTQYRASASLGTPGYSCTSLASSSSYFASPSMQASRTESSTKASAAGRAAAASGDIPAPASGAMTWADMVALSTYSTAARQADDLRAQQGLALNSDTVQHLITALKHHTSSCGRELMKATLAAGILQDIVHGNSKATMLLSMQEGLTAALGAGLVGSVNYSEYFTNTAELADVKSDYLSREAQSIINHCLRPIIRDKHKLLFSCAAIGQALAALPYPELKLALVQDSNLMTGISTALSRTGLVDASCGGYWLQPWNMVNTRLQELQHMFAAIISSLMATAEAAEAMCMQHADLVQFVEEFGSGIGPGSARRKASAGVQVADVVRGDGVVVLCGVQLGKVKGPASSCAGTWRSSRSNSSCNIGSITEQAQLQDPLSAAIVPTDRGLTATAAPNAASTAAATSASKLPEDGSDARIGSCDSDVLQEAATAQAAAVTVSVSSATADSTRSTNSMQYLPRVSFKTATPSTAAAATAEINNLKTKLHDLAAAEGHRAAALKGLDMMRSSSKELSSISSYLQRYAQDAAEGVPLLLSFGQLVHETLQPVFQTSSNKKVPKLIEHVALQDYNVPRFGFAHLGVVTAILEALLEQWPDSESWMDGTRDNLRPELQMVLQAVCDLASLPMYADYKPHKPSSFEDYPAVALQAKIARLAATKRCNMNVADRQHIDMHRQALVEAAEQKLLLENAMLVLAEVTPVAAHNGSRYATRVLSRVAAVVKVMEQRSAAVLDTAVVRRFQRVLRGTRGKIWQAQLMSWIGAA